MEETIIIYTKFYSEAVIEVIDKFDLNIQIMCFSTYEDVLKYVKITPNVRGLIFLEYKPSSNVRKAYSPILTLADEIAGATKQPFAVSFICNNEIPRKVINNIKTENLDIFFTKFTLLNTDLLRFEGLATIILNTIGVANQNIILELDQGKGLTNRSVNSGKIEFLNHCLHITTSKKEDLNGFADAVERYPNLSKLIELRMNGESDKEVLEESENLFKVFAKQCIARRKEDERKGRYGS